MTRLVSALVLTLSAGICFAESGDAWGLEMPGWAPAADEPGASIADAPDDFELGDLSDWRPEFYDSDVQPAQSTSRGRTSSRFTRSRSSRSRFSNTSLRTGARASAFSGLASVPYMIGDTGAGTCISFATIGYFEADISHPTLTCSRLNIAENNRALASDRTYFSYRHFHNSTPGRVFQFSQNLNVDRYTFGVEKTLGDDDWCSVELRVPLERRLTSSPRTIASDLNNDLILDPGAQIMGGRSFELANLSVILKAMLAEHDGFLLSAGVGLTAPTAKDVQYAADINNVYVDYPTLSPPLFSLNNYYIDTHFTNETWYLSPFLAWASQQRDSRFFHQGFMQIELPTNPSRVRYTDLGSLSAVTDGTNSFGAAWQIDGVFGGSSLLDLHAQPLMRINLGGGYYLIDQADNHDYFEQLVAMLELHYTTTLQDAKLSRVPLDFIGVDNTGSFEGAFDAFDPFIGNRNSRVDILNAVVGVSAQVNGTTITNGFTMPLRSGDNRGFDFEYNLQVQRPF